MPTRAWLDPSAILLQRSMKNLLLRQVGGLGVLYLLGVRNVLLKLGELLLVCNLGSSLGIEHILKNSTKLQGVVTRGGLNFILGVLLDHLEDDEAEMQHLQLEMTGLISCSSFIQSQRDPSPSLEASQQQTEQRLSETMRLGDDWM